MKLNKFLKAAAALVVVATALAGCKFEGTKSDFKGDEYNRFAAKTDANNPAPETVTGAAVSIPFGVTFTAEKDQPITVTVTSRAVLDEKSFDEAFNVYTLTDAANNYTPVVKGSTLPKTLRRVAVTYNSNTVTTQIYYYVDATGVTKDTLAFVADATKLKEKTGKLIMNGNGNEKCGEESDSVIAYVDIYAADGSALATLTGNYEEDFAPTFSIGAPTATTNAAENTVTYQISVNNNYVRDANGNYIYPADLKGTLDAMYKLRTYAIGDKAWTTTALDWNYNATGHYYEAKTSALAYGTKYCFEVTPNNTVEWAEAKDYYGHTPRNSWLKNKKSYTAASVWRVATTEPAYICQTDADNRESVSTVEWGSTYYDVATANSFATAQDNILTKSVYSKNKVLISLTSDAKDNDLRFDAYEGFAIVDDKYNIVKTKAPVVYEQDEKGVYAIVLETADSAIDLTSSFTYWVGEKTTLKGNKKHSAQVKFGCPAVELTNTVVGYCAFN